MPLFPEHLKRKPTSFCIGYIWVLSCPILAWYIALTLARLHFNNVVDTFGRNILPFHCQYFQCKSDISAILAFHFKYFQCTNISMIRKVAFHLRYFQCKADI